MKLNKKRISILVSLMCLLMLIVFTLCSFDLPEYVENATDCLSFSQPSRSDVATISQILNYQDQLGQFNSLELVALSFAPNSGLLFALFCLPKYDYTVSITSNITFSMVGTSGSFIQIGLSADGFSVYNTAGYSVSLLSTNCIFYRLDNADITYNSNFNYSNSNTVQASLTSIYNYWDQFYTRVLLYPSPPSSEELESAYDIGYSDGFDTGFDSGYFEGLESGLIWGEDLGYQEGYTEGYQEGIGTGYRDGFLAGEAEGYDTGYADGYQDGYDTGYSDGLEDAPPETVTIVIYEEPVEIDVPGIISSVSSIPDSILSGSFDFEFAGINIYGLLKLLIIVFIISAVIFFIIKRSA